MNKNKRLDRLELILKQKSAGTNNEYIKAKNREMERVRNSIMKKLEAIKAGEPMPEKDPPDEKDLEIIRLYEQFHPLPLDTGARERIIQKLELLRRRTNPDS